ncbi:uv dna damage endonuclease (uv-endonuclease) (uved) [hydrocarbon metagenome]|uniref:Uv dna damage endonuclease (Uv-endonuclease) (Uved) n=1 Tax=hydrocarbon metagenome TaxID=938273 RepID=A0A0W8E4I0_9ZZZZ
MSIGFACLVIGEVNTALSHCRLINAAESKLKGIASANLSALEAMVDYNIRQGISLFRISSDIIPFASHPEIKFAWQDEFGEQFMRIGSKIKKAGLRVSMHPGQYTVLNSPQPKVAENAIMDLQYHAAFMDSLSVSQNGKIILHIGGVYGDKYKASAAFIDNFKRLTPNIQRRLAIENDDRNYSIKDILEIARVIETPVVFDNLHHVLNPSLQECSSYELIKLCGSTWKDADGKPKIHYSQGKAGGSRGAHSNTIKAREFAAFYNGLPDKNVDIMLEVKDKNLSAIKCINVVEPAFPVQRVEEEWARYKYLVLSKSASKYNEIRNMLKNKQRIKALDFYDAIDEAIKLPEDRGAESNAAQHVWGYVKQSAPDADKKRFQKLLQQYSSGTTRVGSLKKHLFKCAVNQKIQYLIDSYYFYLY